MIFLFVVYCFFVEPVVVEKVVSVFLSRFVFLHLLEAIGGLLLMDVIEAVDCVARWRLWVILVIMSREYFLRGWLVAATP